MKSMVYYNPRERQLIIPFLHRAAEKRTLRVNAEYGVYIDKVEVDGVAQPLTRHNIIVELTRDNAATKVEVEAGVEYVYLLRLYDIDIDEPNRWRLLFRLPNDGDPRVWGVYSIPRGEVEIRVEYRIRFADGTFGAPSEVVLRPKPFPGR